MCGIWGVLLDGPLQFDKQISSVIGSSFYQLRLLFKIKHFLTDKTLEMAVHAFITSHLDYSNSLYCGISKLQIARLQLVQNAAARFIHKNRKYDHMMMMIHFIYIVLFSDPKCYKTIYGTHIYMKSSDANASKCHLKCSYKMIVFIKLVYLSTVISLKGQIIGNLHCHLSEIIEFKYMSLIKMIIL